MLILFNIIHTCITYNLIYILRVNVCQQSHHDTAIGVIQTVCGARIVKSHQNSSNQFPQTLIESIFMSHEWVTFVINDTAVIITHKDPRHYQPHYLSVPAAIRTYILTYILVWTIVQPGIARRNSIISSGPRLSSPKTDRERQ